MKRSMKTGILCAALVGCMTIGGVSAYFTDGDTVTNTFTVGKVKMTLTEPAYPGDQSPEVTNLVPNEEIAKDPTVTNSGENDEYVFLEVFVPYASLVTADPVTGEKRAAANIELFSYVVNDGWYEMEDSESAAQSAAHVKEGYVRHLYAYASASGKLTALKGTDNGGTEDGAGNNKLTAGETVSKPLFSYVKMANIVEDANQPEGTAMEASVQKILINGYAIQTTAVGSSDTTADGRYDPAGSSDAETVWDVLDGQVDPEGNGFYGDSVTQKVSEYFSKTVMGRKN